MMVRYIVKHHFEFANLHEKEETFVKTKTSFKQICFIPPETGITGVS